MRGIRSPRPRPWYARTSVVLGSALLGASVVGCSDHAPSPSEPGGSGFPSIARYALVVDNAAGLQAALSPANAGKQILVRAGEYDLDGVLTVPDGVTLAGEGTMAYDDAGLPTGFAGPRTTLRMIANIPGDVVTLGDRTTLRNLEIADLPGRSGNVVAVVSRIAGDRVSTTIAEVEIINPNLGQGLFVATQNLNLGAEPAPHEGAALNVRMVHSVIRSPAGGGSLLAFNFAGGGKVSVALAGNRLGGVLTANGGVSRPDAVHDAVTWIDSRRNLYHEQVANPCVLVRFGWNLNGGSGANSLLQVGETARNQLRFHSVDDRIEGFRTGILATGARRFFDSPMTGLSTDNSLDLTLLGTTISTPACAVAPFSTDLRLVAASPSGLFHPGNGNTLRAVIRGVTGSGARNNVYAHVGSPAGPVPPELHGLGNRLKIAGNPTSFALTNMQIDPVPDVSVFTGGGN